MENRSIAFIVGTGRCGTRFLAELFNLEPTVAASHERQPTDDTFHRFCKWYDLPVDDAGFVHVKRSDIEKDFSKRGVTVSLESSAYLSLSLDALHAAFDPRFILMVRRPDKVVLSYLKKGWYEKPIQLDDPNKIPSAQSCKSFHHFLGRTVPRGEEFVRWNKLTRVGKLAWYWNRLNREIVDQLARIPSQAQRVEKLEGLDYATYLQLSEFVGVKTPKVNPKQFHHLSESRPNVFRSVRTTADWSALERSEFEAEIAPMAAHFGYPGKIADLG